MQSLKFCLVLFFLTVSQFVTSAPVKIESPKNTDGFYGRGHPEERGVKDSGARLEISSLKMAEFCKNLRARRAKELGRSDIASVSPESLPELATTHTMGSAILLDIQRQATDKNYKPLLDVGAANAAAFKFKADLNKDNMMTMVEYSVDYEACQMCHGFRNYLVLEDTLKFDQRSTIELRGTKTLAPKILSLDFFGDGEFEPIRKECGMISHVIPIPQFVLHRHDKLDKFSEKGSQFMLVPDTQKVRKIGTSFSYSLFQVDDDYYREKFHKSVFNSIRQLNPNAVEENTGH